MSRIVCRFSCGGASAVMTKLLLADHGGADLVIENSAMGGEDEDNRRFLVDCERWFGRPVEVRQSDKYVDHMDVWEQERFIKGPGGTACRARLKDDPWRGWRRPDDIIALGYTAEEQDRFEAMRTLLGDQVIAPLIERGLKKADCHAIILRAGLVLPRMYSWGFANTNCKGCCHGGKGYWNKIRIVFPDVFARAARIQRDLGTGARFWVAKDGTPIMLDELDPNAGHYPSEPDVTCSFMCHVAEQDIAA